MPIAARGFVPRGPQRRPRRRVPIPDDRENILPGEPVMLIVEDDPSYARIIVDLARGNGFKVLVAARGADAIDLVRRYQADGGVARRVPARHARMDGAEPVEARSRDPAYSGAGRDAGRGSAARPRARRVRLRDQAGDDRGPQLRAVEDQAFSTPRRKRAAGRGRQRGRARRASPRCSRTTTSTSRPREPAPRR